MLEQTEQVHFRKAKVWCGVVIWCGLWSAVVAEWKSDAFAQGNTDQRGPALCGSLPGAPVAVLHDRWGNGVLGASREVLGVPGGSEDFRGCSPERGN